MKKIISSLMAVSLLLAVAGVVSAKVVRVAGPWDLTGECEIAYTGTNIAPGPYVHTYDIAAIDLSTGDFSGTGFYNPNHLYTEDITGNVTGSTIEFHVMYTGINAGYYVNAEGVITDDGYLEGSATSSAGQTFDFASSSSCATLFEGNHGQWVKMSENKKEAAQSRVGMPAHSKGHTK